MTKRFSHLVWLGAGSASEPAGLLDIAEQVILVEVREAACMSLRQKHSQKNVNVQQRLLNVDGASVEFTEYNLAEYSAIQPTTGLKEIFPGLRAVGGERLNAVRVTDFVNDLALQDQNNLLVIDIADSNLALLKALQQSDQLSQFSSIRVQAGIEPMYEAAATTVEIVSFLQQHNFLQQQTTGDDPDLPWLNFSLNPLSQILQQQRKANDKLAKDLEQVSKHAAAQLAQIAHLEKSNRGLQETNTQLQRRQQVLEREMMKAEAQLDFIKSLLIKK